MSANSLKSNLDRLDAIDEDEIDYSEIPKLDAEFFRDAEVVIPPRKKQVTIRLDTDLLWWFKEQGRGYQSRINAILRAYYDAHRQKA